jgi:hypothetical protein
MHGASVTAAVGIAPRFLRPAFTDTGLAPGDRRPDRLRRRLAGTVADI